MPTMQDIADQLGVSRSTVSRALQSDLRLPLSTRERVMETALKIGYRPNPLVSALMSQIRGEQPGKARANIALLYSSNQKGDVHTQWLECFAKGAKARAMQLGFVMDELWITEPGLTPERVTKILHSRGITGLLVLPHPQPGAELKLDLSHFAAATLGPTFVTPRLHRVSNYQFQTTLSALETLRSRNYQRCGIVCVNGICNTINQSISAAWLLHQSRIPKKDRVPMLTIDPGDRRSVAAWMRKHSPTAVVSLGSFILGWLREEGYNPPEQAAFVCLEWNPLHPGMTGMDQKLPLLGSMGVDLIAEQLNHNEFGIPAIPKTVMVESEWAEGNTVLEQWS